jgi:hypothetical protein
VKKKHYLFELKNLQRNIGRQLGNSWSGMGMAMGLMEQVFKGENNIKNKIEIISVNNIKKVYDISQQMDIKIKAGRDNTGKILICLIGPCTEDQLNTILTTINLY